MVTVIVVVLAAAACGADAVSQSGPLTQSSTRSGAATQVPSLTPTAAGSATLAPSTATAFRWDRMAIVDTPDDATGDSRAVAGGSFGYAAVTSSSPAAVWFSADGTSWSATVLRVPRGTPLGAEAVAASGDAILVAGEYTPCSRSSYEGDPFGDCRPRPASWLSVDGRSWKPSPAWLGPVGERGRSGSLFNQVWAVPTGGWDAAQMFDPSDESDGFELRGPAIWHSSDGLSWERLKAQPRDADECGTDLAASELRAAADVTGRRLAAGAAAAGDGSTCELGVWTSADGRTWDAVVGFPRPRPVVRVVLPAVFGRPWQLLGWNAGGELSLGAGVWRSADLVSWTMDPLPSVATSQEVVLAGTRSAELDVAVGKAQDTPLTWTSDGGTDWRLVEGSLPEIEAVASGPVGVVGLVGTRDVARDEITGFEVWRLAR